MQSDRQHGLIPLLVVIASTAILAGLLLPALSRTNATTRTIVSLDSISQPESALSPAALRLIKEEKGHCRRCSSNTMVTPMHCNI